MYKDIFNEDVQLLFFYLLLSTMRFKVALHTQ